MNYIYILNKLFIYTIIVINVNYLDNEILGGFIMKTVVQLLNENRTGAFATVEDGKPRVRPWMFQFEENQKFYFCTANNKDVYKQLQSTPFAEFTTTSKDMITVRLSGKVVFTKDMRYKEKILNENEGLKKMYTTADNPIFEVFYIEHAKATISDFSGQPPKEINF